MQTSPTEGYMNTHRPSKHKLVIKKTGSMKVDATVYCTPEMKIEDSALSQLADAASLPSVHFALATPDIHQGYGAPIGAVIALYDYICPAAVGYDINCGMRLMTTDSKADELKVELIAKMASRFVPLGEGKSGPLQLSSGQFKRVVENGIEGLFELSPLGGPVFENWDRNTFESDSRHCEDDGCIKTSASRLSEKAVERGRTQLGTLGGGNHFIEFQRVEEVLDASTASAFGLEEGNLTVMVHTGSRGFGHQIGGEYMKKAAAESKDIAPNRELGVLKLSSQEADEYIDAMRCGANFAYANRTAIANLVRKACLQIEPNLHLRTLYDVTHNMAKKELHNSSTLWVHRKGATRAFPASRMSTYPFDRTGQPVLIPGSMGTASYVLVAGENVDESLCSVNHGAGRCMSRTAARGKFRKGKRVKKPAISDERFRESMRGVKLIAANRKASKEEAPDAYKDIHSVIRAVTGAGLAKTVARLRPLAVLKG